MHSCVYCSGSHLLPDSSVKRVAFKRGGPTQAKALLARFLRDRLSGYSVHRKEAHLRHQSFLSPYLHFGQISALAIALKASAFGDMCILHYISQIPLSPSTPLQQQQQPYKQVKQHSTSSAEDRRRFLDELLVWREMAAHFVFQHPDNYDGKCLRQCVHDKMRIRSWLRLIYRLVKHTHTPTHGRLLRHPCLGARLSARAPGRRAQPPLHAAGTGGGAVRNVL